MKKLLFTSVLLFLSLIIFSQNGIYRTYEDYKKNNIEDIGEFKYNGKSGASAHLDYKVEGKKKKFECKDKDFWGFMYEGYLFRNNHNFGGLAYLVVSEGDYIYYENGHFFISVIDALKKGKTKEIRARPIGYYHPISIDLNSKFISTIKVWGQFKKLEKKNSRFTDLKTCFGRGPGQETIRDCIHKDINETENFYPWDKLIKYSFI